MASGISAFSEELAAAAEQAGPSVVTVRAGSRQPSSGIYWRKGVVVTADHGIRREEEISVLGPEGKKVDAKLAGRDPGTDLAVLKLQDGSGLSVPQLADSSTLKLAQFVLALGRTRYGVLVASGGIIGGMSGEWRTWRGGRIDQNIRLSLPLYPGFSGGPLLDVVGKLIGVNTSGLSRGRPVTIPVSTVNRTVDELLEKGHVARPYLGIAMQPVSIPEALRSKLKSTGTNGLLVVHVEPASPAEAAGIVLGDVIVELGGKAVLDTEEVRDTLASAKVNDKLTATVLRGGVPGEISITLAERSQADKKGRPAR